MSTHRMPRRSAVPRLASVFAWTASLALGACRSEAPRAPVTQEEPVAYSLHGHELVDPYRWLEDQESPETQAWISVQNAYADSVVGHTPLRDEIAAQLQKLEDVPNIGSPVRTGHYEYFTLRRTGDPSAAIYRRAAPPRDSLVPIDPRGDYERILDPLEIDSTGWSRVEMDAVSPNGDRLVYEIRDGGEDETRLRIRDVARGADLPDTFPRALYDQASFTEDGRGLYYVRRSRETGSRLYLHRLGTDLSQDRVLFGKGVGPEQFLRMQSLEGGKYRLFTIQWGWARNDVLLQEVSTGAVRPVAVSLPAHVQARYHDGRLWILTDYRAPRYRLMVTDLDQPDPSHWREIVPEGSDVLDDFTFLGDSIYATYLHDVSARIRIFWMDGTPDGEVELPPYASASIRPAAPGKAFLQIGSFTIPQETWILDLASGERTLYEPSRIPFDSSGVVVEQEWFHSKDGTRVPMFIVHRKDVGRTGGAPTMLTGYGGFDLSLTPRFSAEEALWVARGGVYAVATLRGGNEFGEDWHRDGMLQNKQHVFDDFIGAAQHLIDRGYTSPPRLAIHGESNGGLLMGAALTQRPDLFRAVLCGFPDLDLVRFYTFTETNNLPALLEYGNAAVALQFPAILAFSPYQNVVDGTGYPAVFLFNGGHDTRVAPLQARKMTAKLQAATTSGRPVIFRYRPKEGHAAGRGRPFDVMIADQAMEQAFVWQQIGEGRS